MNYFEFYPGDYLKDTGRLRLVEHGAYLKLMLAYYGEEQPLPVDYADLYQIAAAISTSDKEAVRKVADQFFPIAADGLRHKNRVDEEIAKARKRIQIARDNGSKNKAKRNPSANPAGSPAGGEEGTQRDTQPGEALHTPHAMQKAVSPTIPASVENSKPPDTTVGRACLEMRKAGLAHANPSDQRLLSAIDQGVTPQQLGDLVREKPGKAQAWYVAAAVGRLREAGQQSGAPAPAPIDEVAAARQQRRRELEDKAIEIRHKCDKLGLISEEERDRQLAQIARELAA